MLSSIKARYSSRSIFSTGANMPRPAQLTSPSMRPKFEMVRPTRLRASGNRVTSAGTASEPGRWAASSWSFSLLRAASTTCARWLASCCAAAKPIPDEAPVTMITLFSMSIFHRVAPQWLSKLGKYATIQVCIIYPYHTVQTCIVSRGKFMGKTTSSSNQLLETAARLFFQYGYRATGVDTIAAESGVGKMTLYRHYPSKDDLIIAYLKDSDALFWNSFEEITKNAATPREKILAFFEGLQGYVTAPACYGCPFLNLASEYPDADYPGHQVALDHKQFVRARFLQLAEEAGAPQPEVLADGLFLLMDGAYMAARMFGASPNNPAGNVAEAARHLINTLAAI